MPTIVPLNSEVIHRYVCELRYDFGQLYWDRAGRISRQLLNKFEEWDFEKMDGGRSSLSNRDINLTFNFGPEKLDLSQTQSADVEKLIPVGEFSKLAEEATKVVADGLEIDSFSRIGFRVWHLYPAQDRAEAESRVRNLQILRVDAAAVELMRHASDVGFHIVTDRSTHMVRIAVNPFEQQIRLSPSLLRAAKIEVRTLPKDQREARIDKIKAEKRIASYPQHGVLLDTDAFIEDPPIPSDLSVSDFVGSAYEDFAKVKAAALAGRG